MRQAKYKKYPTALLCMACLIYLYPDPVICIWFRVTGLLLDPVQGYRFSFGTGPGLPVRLQIQSQVAGPATGSVFYGFVVTQVLLTTLFDPRPLNIRVPVS